MTTTTVPLALGTWTVDAAHSGIHFQVRHLGLNNVRGRFDRFDATLTVGERIEDTAIEATIDMASVDTNNADRDAHLLSTDFFNAEVHPTMTFRSTRVTPKGGDGYELLGDLTINGVTKPIGLDVEFNGSEVHPADGRRRAGFTATGTVHRNDFGVDFNMPLGVDKVALGDKIKVELDLQFAID
jgi:polyisoprenoid-binding protein YceI